MYQKSAVISGIFFIIAPLIDKKESSSKPVLSSFA